MDRLNKLVLPKIIFVSLLSLLILLSQVTSCFAESDEIFAIDNLVTIQEDASIMIEQNWACNNGAGTEWFVPMYNLDLHSAIEDLAVKANGKQFITINPWQIEKSFNEKAYQCGINHTTLGDEICFAKSEMGTVNYAVKYKVTNVLRKSKDGIAFIYFRFVNDKMKPAPKEVSIKVNYADLGEKVEGKIWGFGFTSELKSEKQAYKTERFAFSSTQHVTLLMRFDNLPGASKLIADERSFAEIKQAALTGSNYVDLKKSDLSANNQHKRTDGRLIYNQEDEEAWTDTPEIFDFPNIRRRHNWLFGIGTTIIVSMMLSQLFIIYQKNEKATNIKDVHLDKKYYYRDVPYAKRIDLMQFFGSMVNGIVPRTDKSFIGAYILKWIREGSVEPCKCTTKRFFISTESEALRFVKTPEFQSKLEEVTYNILTLAAQDELLTAHELEDYARYNAHSLDKNFSYAMKKAKDVALEMHLITFNDEKKRRFSLTASGIASLQNLNGLKNYLRDFTLLNERQMLEVTLWDDYLISAAVFGIAEEVYRELQKLVPNYVFASEVGRYYDSNMYNTLTYIHFANSFAYSVKRGITMSERSRSSGHGGMSSIGGGSSGFSGGGSGGGSR